MTTSVSYEELQQIPSSRDPWVVLQTVPGIIVDRVNVGGAESGQQSNYLAKGAVGSDNTWNIDGIPITDLAATGSSPTSGRDARSISRSSHSLARRSRCCADRAIWAPCNPSTPQAGYPRRQSHCCGARDRAVLDRLDVALDSR